MCHALYRETLGTKKVTSRLPASPTIPDGPFGMVTVTVAGIISIRAHTHFYRPPRTAGDWMDHVRSPRAVYSGDAALFGVKAI